MTITIRRIQIRNCRSLKNINIELSTLTCIVGENGSGKTNLFKAILFFYNNLTNTVNGEELFDKRNPFIDFLSIEITYDLTKIIKIAQRNLEQNPANLHNFFKKVLFEIRPKLNINNELTLKLKYYKDGQKEWNYDSSVLSFIKYLFPIVHIPARHIKLTDWEILWDTIGEITNNKKLLKDQISDEIVNMFDDDYKERLSRDINYIKEEFNNNNVHPAPFTSKQMIAHLIQLEIRGKKFRYNEEDLNYFSDGINSNNFLKVLLSLVNRIQTSKLYQPLIIIDEPEVGLHPKLTDELMESYSDNSKNVNVLIATHSPRVVKNIIGSVNGSLLHVSMNGDYSLISKMRTFTQSRETTIVTENEASYYFSRGILFVEGVTELELFTNKNLISLFPVLKQIDILSFDSNSVKLNLIHPKENNTNIPYLVLLDLDKIIKYDNGKFIIDGDKTYNPLKNEAIITKENYYYGEKRYKTLTTRKRINGILDGVTFQPNTDWQFINDALYEELKLLIKQYCLMYRFYPVETTIEGTLVNSTNVDIFIGWFMQRSSNSPLFQALINSSSSIHYKTTISRLLVSGKFDTLNRINKEFKSNASSTIKTSIDHIATLSMKKTEGWISEFLSYYFNTYLANSSNKIKTFEEHFPELYDIINDVEKMMRDGK